MRSTGSARRSELWFSPLMGIISWAPGYAPTQEARGCGCGAERLPTQVLHSWKKFLCIFVICTRIRHGDAPARVGHFPTILFRSCISRKLPSPAAWWRPADVLWPTGADPAAAHQHPQCVRQPAHRQVCSALFNALCWVSNGGRRITIPPSRPPLTTICCDQTVNSEWRDLFEESKCVGRRTFFHPMLQDIHGYDA